MKDDTTQKYRDARELLQNLSTDYARAVAEFAWPDFGDRFNWAIDWFDAVARGVDRTALWIVEEDGSQARYSFDEMACRSDQVAAHLARHGVRPGDRVLLMLNNQVELTSFWVGAEPGDVHLNISSPGWAKHEWSCFFAPWIAEATISSTTTPTSTRPLCSTRSAGPG